MTASGHKETWTARTSAALKEAPPFLCLRRRNGGIKKAPQGRGKSSPRTHCMTCLLSLPKELDKRHRLLGHECCSGKDWNRLSGSIVVNFFNYAHLDFERRRRERATMAEVFISYAKADRNLAQQLAANLEAQGRTTWWDPGVDAPRGARDTIERELKGAQKVIVLWSKASIASPFVLHEAIAARDAGKLVQVKTADIRASDVARPLRTLPLLDLGDLSGIARALWEHQNEVNGLARQAVPSEQVRSSTAKPINLPEPSAPTQLVAGRPAKPRGRHWARTDGPRSKKAAVATSLLAAGIAAITAFLWKPSLLQDLSDFAAKLVALLK